MRIRVQALVEWSRGYNNKLRSIKAIDLIILRGILINEWVTFKQLMNGDVRRALIMSRIQRVCNKVHERATTLFGTLTHTPHGCTSSLAQLYNQFRTGTCSH